MERGRDGKVLFLPGATGDGDFWKSAGEMLPSPWEKCYLSWPGLGRQPRLRGVDGIEGLVRMAKDTLDRPSAVVAQSMGGIIGLALALEFPDLVTRLVLAATSGGINVTAFGAKDWREEFLAEYPDTDRWILGEMPDMTRLISTLTVPTLLLWGEDDPISPPSVGEYLAGIIPDARLVIIPRGGHSFCSEMAGLVAPRLIEHLTS